MEREEVAEVYTVRFYKRDLRNIETIKKLYGMNLSEAIRAGLQMLKSVGKNARKKR